MVQEGPYDMDILGGNPRNCIRGLRILLYTTWGDLCQSKICKLELTFVKACSDFLPSHERKCNCAWLVWQHGGSLVTER
jgi:hypothetical protein